MNLDDLKVQWRTEVEQATPPAGLRFETIRRDVAGLDRSVRFRNFSVILALGCGSTLSVFFGWLALDDVAWVAKLSIAANVLATVWIAVVLLHARRVSRSDDWTLRSRLEIEIERLEKERSLWRYGALWLLVPMSAGVLLQLPVRLYWVWFVVCALAWWSVRYSAHRAIDPLLSRLKSLHRELLASE